jgi:hypothetical protein
MMAQIMIVVIEIDGAITLGQRLTQRMEARGLSVNSQTDRAGLRG